MIDFYQGKRELPKEKIMQRQEVEQIRVALQVLNLTSGYGMVWVAESHTSGDLGRRTYGIESTYRFYLVPDDSELLSGSHPNVIKA